MVTRTITCVATPTAPQAEALRETMVAFNGACNYVSAVAWKERTFDKRRLQRLVYYPIRAEFGLPAQLAIRAIAKVADTYRVSKATLATFHPMGAATYDSRILSLKNLSTVSLTTLQGRIKVGLNVGGYQTNRLAGAVLGETDLLWNPEKRRFSFAFSVKQETLPPSEPTEFLGVDLGIKNIAVDSDGNRYAGGKLRRYRKKSRRLRGRLQKLGTRGSRRLIAKRPWTRRPCARRFPGCSVLSRHPTRRRCSRASRGRRLCSVIMPRDDGVRHSPAAQSRDLARIRHARTLKSCA